MKSAFILFSLMLTLALPQVSKANENAQQLVQGCKELTAIYASRDQQRRLATMTTSLSEAMMAGYCMGVVKEYQRKNYCEAKGWYQLASRLAELPNWYTGADSIDRLLGKACAN